MNDDYDASKDAYESWQLAIECLRREHEGEDIRTVTWPLEGRAGRVPVLGKVNGEDK